MPKMLLAPLPIIVSALIACSGPASTPGETLAPAYTPIVTETPVPTEAPQERPTPAPPAAQAESPTPDTTREIISVRTGTHRKGAATPTTPAAVATPAPARVIPPTRTEAAPTATATPSPFAHLDIDIHRETHWRDLLDGLYPHERSCIEVEAGADGLDTPVLDDYPYVLDEEVAMFGCLEPGTARAVLLGATVAGFEEDDDFRVPQDELACIRDMLTGMDAAAVVAAMATDANNRLPAGEFLAGFFRCIPKTLVNLFAALDTIEDFVRRMDCTRKVLDSADAEIMVALMWEDAENPEVERFLLEFMDCLHVEDEYGGIPDDHADRIREATLVEVGHTLLAAMEYVHDTDFFAFVAERGTIYQIGAGLGTLEGVWISLYGPLPDYDELHTASSYGNGENGQVASISWQSPYTDMVFVSVSGEGGTGEYSFFVNAVNLHDDHANIRGKGTPLNVGEKTWGELEFFGDVDAFRLDALEGTVYEVTLDLATLDEAILEVEDIHGNPVTSVGADAGRSRYGVPAAWKAETSGFHFIYVQGAGEGPGGTGAYSLSTKAWQDDHGDSSETATPLSVGEYVKSRIDTLLDVDYFVFQAEEGASYLIECELGDVMDIGLSLLDRRGEITSDDSYLHFDQYARIHWEAPAAGEYWVAVSGRGPGWEGSTGTYSIVVKETTQPEQ